MIPLTNDNIVTWNEIIYCYIMAGLQARESEMPYGERMRFAEELANDITNRWKIVERLKKLSKNYSLYRIENKQSSVWTADDLLKDIQKIVENKE